MSHQSVVQLIQDTAQSLADNIQFGYGRRSDFNIIQSKSFPYIWLAPLTASISYTVNNTINYQKTWNCSVLFFELDREDSIETEYKPILDTLDTLVDKFLNRLNDWSLTEQDNVGAITIRNITQNPFFKTDSDVLTGWVITFQLITPDDFLYCTPDNIAIYAGTV